MMHVSKNIKDTLG